MFTILDASEKKKKHILHYIRCFYKTHSGINNNIMNKTTLLITKHGPPPKRWDMLVPFLGHRPSMLGPNQRWTNVTKIHLCGPCSCSGRCTSTGPKRVVGNGIPEFQVSTGKQRSKLNPGMTWSMTGWWLNQPIWKIWVKMEIFPK